MADEQLKREIEKDVSALDDFDFKSLESQIQAEYQMAWDHQQDRIKENLLRLRLYNNQRRDKSSVGDSTMFTIIQTVLASLYEDKLKVTFVGREEGDDETAQNLNALAEFDYKEMGKDIIDFLWIWDTLFFGRGLVELSEYRRDPESGVFVPIPRVLDPATLLRDPRAEAVNGTTLNGDNAARFLGREVKMTMEEMREHPDFDNLDGIKLGSDQKSLMKDAEQARADAQGHQFNNDRNEKALEENAEYDILEWYTHWKDGGDVKKVKVWLANSRSKVVGIQEVENGVWPIIDRSLYPTAHNWDGVSIPDLTEDKQRARAVAQNLSLDAMRADLYPMYIFDSNKVKNRNDLTFKFNKFIPIDGPTEGAVNPLRKAGYNLGLLDFIYNSLDTSAQLATATPDLQRGALSEQERTLGELNLAAEKTATRFSLSARIFGWSEQRFWRQWYYLYKEYFGEDIDKKVIRIVGAFGPAHRDIDKAAITTMKYDPDIEIESEEVTRARNQQELQRLSQYFASVLQDPTANRRWAQKKMGMLNGMTKDEIDRLLPPTIEEMVAEDENELLDEEKFVRVLPNQDHTVHLEIHSKVKESTAKVAHIEAHKAALTLQRTNPELFPELQAQAGVFDQTGTPTLSPPGGAATGLIGGEPAQQGPPSRQAAVSQPSQFPAQ